MTPPLRLGLLSTARVNRHTLGAVAASERVRVVAIASRDEARARAYAVQHGIERAHGSYEALLADPEVDAVYIPLPNGLHHEWTMRALGAGKHVLCEKPYSRHPVEVEEAFDAAGRAGRVLMEAFMYRHHPQTRAIEELVRGGRIGRLIAIRSSFTFALADPTNVRLTPSLDGGALLDVGCYCVSVARLLGGEPLAVSAEQVVGPSGVDLAIYGTMRLADDVVAQLEASFQAPWRQQLEVIGAEGRLEVAQPFRSDSTSTITLHHGGAAEIITVPETNAYRAQLEQFADAAQGWAPALLGRQESLGQARALAALRTAANEGRRITLTD